MQRAGEASPFLRDQCVLLAILPTGDVLAKRDVINYACFLTHRFVGINSLTDFLKDVP